MNFIFWLLWTGNLLLLLLVMLGKSFRSGFGAGTGLNTFMIIGLVIILVSGLLLKYIFRQPRWSLFVIFLPIAIMFIMFLLEKKTNFQ